MKNFAKSTGAFIIALLMVVAFYAVMLHTGIASKSLAMIIGVIGFTIFILFSTRKKSVPMVIISAITSAALFYSILGINILGNNLTNFLAKTNIPWLNYGIIVIIALIVVAIAIRIYKFFAKIYILLKPDEAHVITHINGSQIVYSGTDLEKNPYLLGKEYGGNHYFDFSKMIWMKMFLGMTVQKTRLDDLRIEINDIHVKSECKAELQIGRAVFHFCVLKPLTIARKWPGEDMDIERFKTETLDIIEESVEITTNEYPIEKLVGGNLEVNNTFKETLESKLEEDYGISITNAKLSQESGPAVDLVKKVKQEKLRGKSEVATQKANLSIQAAKTKTQEKINLLNLTEAEGSKAVTIKNAEAEAEKIEIAALAEAKKIVAEGGAKAKALLELLKAQSEHKDVFTIGSIEKIVAADASRFPELTTMFGGGEKGKDQINGLLELIQAKLGVEFTDKNSTGKNTSDKPSEEK